ncbi:hypothetical protein MBLNU459_g3360t1 [Dothideomycetes sp. NU459]
MASQQETYTGKAIVSRDTLANKGWKMEDVTTRAIKDDELVVEMVASGICHTDVLWGSIPDGAAPTIFYPRVLGHEGSGYVKAVGSKVTVAKPGDPVILSFDSCNSCATCKAGTPSLCYSFVDLNFGPNKSFAAGAADASSSSPEIDGRFFGQSSFARYSVVSETSVVNATELIRSKEELELFAPLGCGIQTGSGTVLNVANAQPSDVVAIQGLGGVGLSAIMAARIAGCRTIIGIDRVECRLAAAKEFGATHVVDTSKLPEGKTVVQVVQEISDGVGPTVTIDTTGVPALIKSAVETTRFGGKIIQVGSAPADFNLEVPVFTFMVAGKAFIGAIEGNSVPREFLPKLIQWYREGKFPFDKMVKLMPAADFEKGLHEMHSGETIKPVLTWS